jgi:AcrR family transcriptional regulator
MGMSKSGVFAHFGSREELQISVVREYHARFEHMRCSSRPAQPRGLPRVRAMFDNWMKRTGRRARFRLHLHQRRGRVRRPPGPVRDALAESVGTWLAAMARAWPRPGQGRPPARRCRRRTKWLSRSTR